jgi:carbon storage regulator
VLVLTRKVGERILIGENIAVTVVKLTGGGVRLGIEAPPELAVVREELALELQEAEVNVLPFPVPESLVE